MKLITWNCQGAFRKKAGAILKHRPDILVVQECEHPDKLIFNDTTKQPTALHWFGNNFHKGLGVFSYSNYKFEILKQYNADYKIIAPIAVTGGKIDFTLFAIWANNSTDPDGRYVEQVWKAIHYYKPLFESGHTILAGDFNSNTIWDRPQRVGNHTAVVDMLEAKNIFSVYHKHFKQEQGKEKHPTFYLYRNKEKSYHIDYCFASERLFFKVKKFEIGTYEKWKTLSDHTPLIITFDLL